MPWRLHKPQHAANKHHLVRPPVILLVLIVCFLAALVGPFRTSEAATEIPSTTADHLASSGWWPTKHGASLKSYAGADTCAKCHVQEASTQPLSAMARAAFRAAGTSGSGKPAPGVGVAGAYQYQFVLDDSGYSLQVKSGDDIIRSKILWTFGAGNHGQTYILTARDSLYEGQISSFNSGHIIGLTPGHQLAGEGSLQEAIGNKLSTSEATRCFSCHTTAWENERRLDLTAATPGVHCEACHGPGAEHVSTALSGQFTKLGKTILNPAHLSPVNSIDFCGACHRTTMDVALNGKLNALSSLRFQPYRLQKSRCWTKTEDARLTCVACHNPHEPLVHDASAYDNKCLSCHATQSVHATSTQATAKQAPACPRATSNCTTCHMQKLNVPEMHSDFTDHFIRIVRADQPLPD